MAKPSWEPPASCLCSRGKTPHSHHWRVELLSPHDEVRREVGVARLGRVAVAGAVAVAGPGAKGVRAGAGAGTAAPAGQGQALTHHCTGE